MQCGGGVQRGPTWEGLLRSPIVGCAVKYAHFRGWLRRTWHWANSVGISCPGCVGSRVLVQFVSFLRLLLTLQVIIPCQLTGICTILAGRMACKTVSRRGCGLVARERRIN
jgi:hypothetical protein